MPVGSWYPIGRREAKFVTPWDIRTSLRALGATVLAVAVVWLVTAASDEGQLTAGARAGRTLPLAPLCSAVGAALALGSGRIRHESRAFEALGRSPTATARSAALGAALPSLAVALAIASVPSVDVDGFFPRAARDEVFVAAGDAFESPTLGVRIDVDGEAEPLTAVSASAGGNLPRFARASAALATALAGLSLALVTARATLRRSLLDARARRRMRASALGEALGCAVLTLVAFQAAATHRAPAPLAVIPPLALLALALLRLRSGEAAAAGRRRIA